MMPHGHHIYQKNLTRLWVQYLPTHWSNMCFHIVNVSCIVIKIVYVLIYQVRNQISITPTHVLQYIFTFTKCSCTIRFMEYLHKTKNNIFVVFYSVTNRNKRKTIHNKSSCIDGYIYLWLSNKSLNSRSKDLALHLPHVRIIGTHHCGNKCREAFKHRGYFQDVLCSCDYEELVVAIFEHKI